MKVLLLAVCSTALTALVISNAYYKNQQFYPTVVYLQNSNRSMLVLYVQAFVTLYLLCVFIKKTFFGVLRDAEIEHLIESSWFAVLETFILLAAFHQELSMSFVAMISMLFICKSFHWLAGDRVDYMERSPLISWLFHLRAISISLLLGGLDCLFVMNAWSSLKTRGLSVEIVFGLEYAVMFLNIVNTFIRYVLHTIDLQSEDPWENKTIYLRCVDIFLGFFKLLFYVSYMSLMLYVLFIPLHIARRLYITAKNFQKSIADVVSSHRAIRNLNTLYPDATAEELNTANNICIICREEMADRCKKLPCNHIFHMSCLRSWFQRQQTCPTCRMDVLSDTTLNRPAQERQGPQAEQRAPPGVVIPPPPMMWPGMVPPGMPAQQNQAPEHPERPPEQQRAGPAEPPQATNAPATAPANPGPGPPFMGPPPFMPGFGMMPPLGGMPSGEAMARLTDQQLLSLEGMERANVEARIELLRNVQALLDSAVAQLNQYSTVMASLGPAAGPGFNGFPSPPGLDRNLEQTDVQSQNSTSQANTESQTSLTGSGKLTELKPTFSFTGEDIENEQDPSEVVRQKPAPSPEAVEDMEGLRNRRLQRFNSTPQTGPVVMVTKDDSDTAPK